MKKTLLIALVFGMMTQAQAAVDLSQYNLKPHQITLLKKLEAKGYSDEKIRNMAENFQNYNLNGPRDRDEYVPPHTWQELMDVTDWAAGASFSGFAQYAGVDFDNEAYRNDCPNWALFNFGRATGTEYIKIDVLAKAINLSYALQQYYSRDESEDKSNFKKEYFRLLKEYNFEQYLID